MPLSGVNSTVFAYGQTSSGKTFTMMGITEYAIVDIYDYIEKHNDTEFLLKFSAMEIYNESVRDLLSTDSTPHRNLDDPERGTFIEKLTEEPLKNWNHVMELLSICEDWQGQLKHPYSCYNFVDLAGNERASQSLSAGTRLKEGCHINRILLTLGTIIRKLSKGRNGHVPLRDSKLTHILQSSLGDNARTAIICTMNPPRSHRELARLESELRSQGPTFVASHYSALLREKGLQIEKLEKKMIDLAVQRDLAQSQVQDLLQLVLITSHACNGRSSDDHYTQILPEFEENFVPNDTSPQLLVGASMFIRSNFGWSWDMIEEKTNGTSEDLCKEVRCIEAEESNRSSSPEQNTEISELMWLGTETQQIRKYMHGSQSLKLTKSRSCKASLMTSPYSPWFEKVEHNDNEHTPPNGFENEFTGRPEDIQRRFYELNYGANIERLSRKGSQSTIGSVAAIDLEAHRGRTSTDDNITSVNTCIVHESEPKAKESLKNVKVVGLDPIEDDSKSLSNWPSKFKRTNFFLLFKGDPTDSIYMEVDLRRLSSLKDTLSQGSKTVKEGQTLLPTSRRLIHGDVSGFVSGASESCDMDTAFACSHLHLH
ncbi:unnamed protein product [Camellia sinensis]